MSKLLSEVYENYRKANRAYAAMIELTYRCVCRCVHCYIDDYHSEEMSTREVIALLDQLKDEGVIDIGFTGGEIFLREDLPTILEEAVKRGFLAYVLTTGILIGEKEADLLKANRIHHAEISLMGATAATHDSVMRHPGAFDKTLRAVNLLKERGIPVVLKNSVLKQNVGELRDMANLASSLGLPFSASLSVLPKINGDKSTQGCAVSLDEALALDPALLNGGLIPGEDESQGARLTCNAGRTICGISPTGEVFPCLIWRQSLGNVKTQAFSEIWHGDDAVELKSIRAMVREDAEECVKCAQIRRCRRCPGLAFSETGDCRSPVLSACALAGKK